MLRCGGRHTRSHCEGGGAWESATQGSRGHGAPALSWTAEGTKTHSHKSPTQTSAVASVAARRHLRVAGKEKWRARGTLNGAPLGRDRQTREPGNAEHTHTHTHSITPFTQNVQNEPLQRDTEQVRGRWVLGVGRVLLSDETLLTGTAVKLTPL